MSAYLTTMLSEQNGRIYLLLAFALLAGIIILALLLGVRLGRRAGRLEAERGLRDETRAARDDAVRRSRAVLTGQIGEQLAPFFPGFPCDPGDARFIGKPVDFVAFPGAGSGAASEVLFIEIKSGDARLTAGERAIRDAIKAGRVRWVEYRVPLDTGTR